MIEHRQVHHLVQSLQQEIYQCGEQTLRMALLAPFHFDASVKQIFASLLLGQTLYIVPKTTVTNGSALLDYYRQNRIEATDGTPAHLQMMVAAGEVSGHQLFSNSRGQALSPNEHVAQFNSADISRRNHHLQMRRRSVSGFNPVLTIIVQQCRAIRHSRFRHDIKN